MSCKDFCRLMFLFFDWDLYYSFSLGVEILLSVCRLFWFTWFCPDLLLRFMCSACYSDFGFRLVVLINWSRAALSFGLYVPIYGSRYCPDLNRIQCSDLVWIIDLSVVLFCSVWLSWFIRSCAELTFGFNCSGFMISLSCWFGLALVFWHDLIYFSDSFVLIYWHDWVALLAWYVGSGFLILFLFVLNYVILSWLPFWGNGADLLILLRFRSESDLLRWLIGSTVLIYLSSFIVLNMVPIYLFDVLFWLVWFHGSELLVLIYYAVLWIGFIWSCSGLLFGFSCSELLVSWWFSLNLNYWTDLIRIIVLS